MGRTSHITLIQLVVIGLTLLGWTSIFSSNASAHGEGGLLRVQNQLLGTSYLHVWTSPAIPRPGKIHVETLVTDEALQPLGQQRTVITLLPLSGDSEPQRVVAGTVAGAAHQEAAFLIEQPGDYQVEITVLATAGQGGRHRFDMQVVDVHDGVKVALQGILLLIAGIGLWLLGQGLQLITTQS